MSITALYAALLSSQLAPPVNTVLPVITGTARVGLPLSVSNGTWSNSPTGFTYQWTSGGTPISGETASTYTLVGADNGNTIACTVTATNAGGSTNASATGVVVSPAQFSLVGTAGAISTSTSGGAVTPAFGAGETRAANNLLVCWVAGGGHSTAPTTPAGWSVAEVDGVGTPIFGSATVFYKIATGADAAPTIAALASEVWVARVAEFQGNAHATPLDQVGLASGATPRTATAAADDSTAGELVIAAAMISIAAAGAVTSSMTMNNGATATTATNDATSITTHANFGWGVTTGNTAADTAAVSSTGGTLNGIIVAVATFKLAT